jgi:branched-chain amino acid transport system permease protein
VTAQGGEVGRHADAVSLLATIRRWRTAQSGTLFLAVLGTIFAGLVVLTLVNGGPFEAGQQLVNGLQQGAIYALIAVGYTMVYGIIELINFAHGDVFTLSAFYSVLYVAFFGHVFHLDLNSLASGSVVGLVATLAIVLPLTMLSAGVTGVLIERIAYRRLRDAPRLAPLITAIGMSFLLEGIMFAVFGSGNVSTGEDNWLVGTAFRIGAVNVTWTGAFVVSSAIVLMFLLQSYIRLSRLGKAMRATAQNRDAALVCGININRTIAATFFLGSAIAGAGAVIYSMYNGLVKWNLGFQFGIIAFTAAVLGGIGNIVGAGVGGFLIGLVSVFGGYLIGGEWSNSIIFVMLIVVLIFRPTGLFGIAVHERA